ncbi:MAG: glycosyltransferase [Glaciihabitans sp.]|nr:glycosyltransferase [Glaciihabitans sp.]
MTTLVLIAKETIAGRVKTRLHPALSFEQAAQLAAASISDTLAAVADLPATRRVLLFDGTVIPAGAENYEVIPQVAGDLDERLGAIFDILDGPTILIGMDTPQISAQALAPAFAEWPSGVDAFFGHASDGGFWALGLDAGFGRGDLIRGVPMSKDNTGAVQLNRLAAAGLGVQFLPTLTDVDTIDNAREVAELIPNSQFAETLARFTASNADQGAEVFV